MNAPAEEMGEAAWAYTWVDRRLAVLAILVPNVCAVVLEGVHHVIAGDPLRTMLEPEHLTFLLILITGVTIFGLIMLRLIGRAQDHVTRQNHQLAATNAVTQAVQGKLSADAIADHALTHVLAASGAREATITLAPGPEVGSRELVRTLVATPAPVGDPLVGPEEDRVVEVPLHGSDHEVGRLRLVLPSHVPAQDALALGTLRTIGHQVAMAVELSHFVGDLHRRKDEGHAFYDVLLQIGGQVSPLLVLSTIVQYARDLIAADAAVLTVTEEIAHTLALAETGGGPIRSWVSSGLVSRIDPPSDPTDRASVEALLTDLRWGATASAPINGPGGPLGQLWVGRTDARAVTGRGHGFLMTLAELTSIALTSAQQRELAEARSVVEERERIAREMHDSLAQVLGATHLRLRALEVTPGLPEVSVREITAIADSCADAYKDVREGILGLRGEHAGRRQFEDSLRTYVGRWSEQSGIRAAYENHLGMPLALSARSEVQLLRVVQEALTNVRKHSAASCATVSVRRGEDDHGRPTTVVTVSDDGQGFVGGGAPEAGAGFGMVTMHDRLAMLGGTLAVKSTPGRGTSVIATVPEGPRSLSASERRE